MIEPCTDSQFRASVARLRSVCPPPQACSLRVVRVADLAALGYTAKSRRAFTIEIRAAMCADLTDAILVHEWAHMLDWHGPHPLAHDHGATWGVWHARIYQRFHRVE